MDISKIEIGTVPNEVNVVIEIPFGSSIKYEVDKETGAVVVDRVMRSAVYYPANYGFIPHTLAGDDDPIDVLVLNEYELQAGSVICCRLIGVLLMDIVPAHNQRGLERKIGREQLFQFVLGLLGQFARGR